jgi:hypothetical protein
MKIQLAAKQWERLGAWVQDPALEKMCRYKPLGYEPHEVLEMDLTESQALELDYCLIRRHELAEMFNQPLLRPHRFTPLRKGEVKGLLFWRSDLFFRILLVDVISVPDIHAVLRDDDFLGHQVETYLDGYFIADTGWRLDEEALEEVRRRFK